MERDEFLGRVRRAVSTADLPDHPDSDPGPLVPDMADVDPTEQFTRALEGLGGQVHRGDPADELAWISSLYDGGPFIAWDDVDHLAEVLAGAGRPRLAGVVPVGDRLGHQQTYGDLVMGVTTAEAGLAETGSIVLRSGPGRPRMASVVPLVHVAVLAVSDLHRSLSHWVSSAGSTIGDASNVVVITGPSRTADIEQQITIGVHGPRHVHVILV